MDARGSLWLSAAVAAVLLTGAPSAALAQEEVEPAEVVAPTKPWSNEAQLALVDTAGNSSSRTFAVANRFTYNWTYSELILTAELFRQSSESRVLVNEAGGVREDVVERVDAERYEAGAKFRQNLLDELFWYGLASWYQNEPAGVDSRLNFNGGLGYRFLETADSLVAGELGAGMVREELAGGPSDSFVDGRAYLEVRHRFSESAAFQTEVEVLDNLQDTADLRLNAKASVTADLTDIFALRVGWDLKYDNRPAVLVVGSNPEAPPAPFVFDKTDRTLSASLVVSF